MKGHQSKSLSRVGFSIGPPYCCFDEFQQTDYQYAFKSENGIPFTGKELDSETGYSYFGARYYDAELSGLFFSVDPMSDKYPNISSYAYCAWNPLKLVDPIGMDVNPVYTIEGEFLGNTKEGFTGDPLIMNKSNYEFMMDVTGTTSISELTVEDVKKYNGSTFDDVLKIGEALRGEAQEKILKNIITQYNDPQISELFNVTFIGSDVADNLRYDADNKVLQSMYNFGSDLKTGEIFFKHNNWTYEFTVENIISSIVYHEWLGHGQMGYGNNNEKAIASQQGTHYACYLAVITSPIFSRTTSAYQKFNNEMFDLFFK